MLSEWVTENWLVIAGLVGLMTGSFLNVVIYRLPKMMEAEENRYAVSLLMGAAAPAERDKLNLMMPASHCPECKTPVVPYDNIPVISWLLLRGRCRQCQQAIHWRYPATEAFMMVAAIGLALVVPAGAEWVMLLAFCAIVTALGIIDFQHQLLPDCLTYSLLWLGLLWNSTFAPERLGDAILGAVSGYLCLRMLYEGAKWVTNKECMGFGDFKMLAALGVWFGWQAISVLLLTASATSLTVLFLRYRNLAKIRGQAFPFGPGLAFAGLVFMVFLLRE